MACKKFLKLNNGLQMPALGIGTWRAPDDEVKEALNLALEAGYRFIDAAPVYLNEKAIGGVLKHWLDSGKVKRDELYVCTKLPLYAMRATSVEKYLKKSLDDLQLEYVDMYLIHVPMGIAEPDEGSNVDNNTNHVEIWKKMEEMVSKGLTKSIGISNFNKKQIQRILDNSTIKPANLQIELHIYFPQHDLVNFCKSNNIVVTAYSPLGSKGIEALISRSTPLPNLLQNIEVVKIANRLNKSSAQILLHWIIQRDVATIPKSTNPERLKQNLDIFDFTLTDEDMSILGGLDQGLRICDLKFLPGIDKHPEFPW